MLEQNKREKKKPFRLKKELSFLGKKNVKEEKEKGEKKKAKKNQCRFSNLLMSKYTLSHSHPSSSSSSSPPSSSVDWLKDRI